MTKKDLENCTKCWFFDNEYIYSDVKLKHHRNITGKYRGSTERDFNINVKLNHKISVIFYNLKMFDSDLIMQKLDKFNYKINVTPNVLEK